MRCLLMHKFCKGVFRLWNNSIEKNEIYVFWLTFAGRHLALGTFAIPGLQDFNFSNLAVDEKGSQSRGRGFLSNRIIPTAAGYCRS